MSSQDAHYVAARKGLDSPTCDHSGDASQTILLSEYGALLRTIEPLRIINRTLVIGLSLMQGLFSPSSLSKEILLYVVAALTCGFWFLQEFVTGRKLGRLGELIAATDADEVAADEAQSTHSVVVPPPKKQLQTGQIPMAQATSAQHYNVARTSFGQSWTNSYIAWRREAWKNRRLSWLQRWEPIVWFLLVLSIAVHQLVFR